MGVAAVRGLQGDRPGQDAQRVLATAKHFAVHGQPEGGANAAPANYAERIIREQFLAPFQAAVQDGNVAAVMASYNEINGVPTHINPWLLKQVLRQEWGFDGFVFSDGWGVDELVRIHHVAEDRAEAARKSLLAGVDLELGSCFANLLGEVESGRVPVAVLDSAVLRVLRVKFLLGLFENPFVETDEARHLANARQHRPLALEAARKAIVLLKNEGDLLPLDESSLHALAVIGPNAASLRLGGYTGRPRFGVSVLEGLRQKLGDRVKVLYAEGCRLTQNNDSPLMWWDDGVAPADPVEDARLIAEAVATARQAQVALVVVGDNEQTCREGWSAQHLGDRDTLDLVGRQDELIRAVVETGVPTILLLINGRPASINYAVEHVPAILEGWYLGQETGVAVAETLFGENNPAGRLPITFPRSVGQIPAYYYHKPSARRGYLFTSLAPLFPFGHGLSYTTFAYSDLRLTPENIHPGENCLVQVEVRNTGDRAGDEVAQLYLHDQLASLTRPVKELKGFQRITLQPGESRTVSFTITPGDLSFLDIEMQRVVEPGRFDIQVGGSSDQLLTAILEVV
jgi:beta-glucosidase